MVELIRDHDGRSVAELAEELDVSKATVRRDLGELEADGLVERSHGGAVPATAVGHEQPYGQREVQRLDAKIAIGERAIDEVHEGDVVLFDSGTTTMQVAKRTPPDLAVRAVTNSPLLALELATRDVDVSLTGGTLRETTRSLVGPSTERYLRRRHFDVAFVGTNAVDPHAGLSTPNEAEANVKRLLVERAERVVLLADASKFGEHSVVRFADCSAVDLLITDDRPGDEIETALSEADVDLSVVDGS